MNILKRDFYLEKLIEYQNTKEIKVITGFRKVGKSTLLQSFVEYLRKEENESNIVFIDLQALENSYLLNYEKLHEYALSKRIKGAYNVLIIDGINLCENFEKAINSIYVKNIFDIYIAGSYDFLNNSDFATLLVGRTRTIEVFPFSYREYLMYFHKEEKYDKELNNYLMLGGMPGSYVYNSQDEIYAYENDLFLSVFNQDLVEKYNIRRKTDFLYIAKYLMDNVGNVLSINKIASSLGSNVSINSQNTLANYLSYLENAFIFYRAPRYDLKGKKYLSTNNKYYLVDHSFCFAINGTKNIDFGQIYENMVYLELKRKGYEVYIGKLYNKEVDFVANNYKERIYIQVATHLEDEAIIKRETTPLLSIKDAYKKVIIARTRRDDYTYKGIKIIDLARFLSGISNL